MPYTLRLVLLIVIAGLLLKSSQPTQGCATAPPPGAQVDVASEEAIILWNPATHTENFIRRADFESKSSDFGFLVPTPSPPHLAKADEILFEMLETYQPRPVAQPFYGLKLVSLISLLFQTREPRPATISVAGPPVTVLDTERIAGYDAVVLKADDAAALTTWLRTHGYDARPALTAWLQPYVARHWTVTAFKIAKYQSESPTVSSATVRMSFATDRPFFPYSEPADQRDGKTGLVSRLLRVYCLSDARMDGALDSPTVRWPGRARWAETLPTTRSAAYSLSSAPSYIELSPEMIAGLTGVPRRQIPRTLWLTAFEDMSSPRPGVADLSFTRSAQQTPLVATVAHPEDHRLGIPIELVLGAGLIFGIVAYRRRQRRPRRLTSAGGA